MKVFAACKKCSADTLWIWAAVLATGTRRGAEQSPPLCGVCHGPGARRRNPFYPDLAGQHGDYLVLQLHLFKAGKRGGTPYAHLMEHVAPHLSEAQIRDVAAYYSAGISKN